MEQRVTLYIHDWSEILFGKYFRELRKRKNMTQNDIAEIIGKKKMLISGVGLGKNGSFLEEDLLKIAHSMKLDENETRELMKEAAKSRDTIPRNMINYIYQNEGAYNLLYLLCEEKASKEQLKILLEFYRDSYENQLREDKNV